jgi:hypothetical protein
VEEGEDIFFSTTPLGEREKICWLCATIEGIICECGSTKKPEHLTCWNCKVADDIAAGLRCVCGKPKKPQYPTCYSCKTTVQIKEE